MRLIDADNLGEVVVKIDGEEFIQYQWIKEQPTVKAIPIDWIRSQKVDYQNKYLPFDYCRGMQDGYNVCIDYLISEWEKENEQGSID